MSATDSRGGRKFGSYGEGACPRCGATRSHQKYPIRRPRIDLSAMQLVYNLHPADGVVCKQCGTAFRVTKLDTDGDYLISDDELECVPNYCPVCGRRVVE